MGLVRPTCEAGEEEEGAVQSRGPGTPHATRLSLVSAERHGCGASLLRAQRGRAGPEWGFTRHGETLAFTQPKREALLSPPVS